MKIEQKIVLSNAINVALIVLIGFFAFQNLNLVLTKLRFVEIADDLNASFLEMRLSEKNFFLYRDAAALSAIREKIDKAKQSISLQHDDMVRAVGEAEIKTLAAHLQSYSSAVDAAGGVARPDMRLEMDLRAEGRKLKEFSETITRLERTRVNDIIAASKRILMYSIIVILVLAAAVSHFISQKILRSLRQIERLTQAISEGSFRKIEGPQPNDELGSVINAVNSMSAELGKREEELIQSKKLASLGVLTAGVAHELTNPLNNISMIAQNVIEFHDVLSRENAAGLMNNVLDETVRIEKIVRNLLDFSKPREGDFENADMNETVRNALKLIQNTLDISNVETRLRLSPNLPHVLIDTDQMRQVLVNLMINATQAMPSGGVLTITTGSGENGGARIIIEDTGKGIPPEYLPHIFDPFFTTKGVGGTGLGLSVSYGIVRNHKGSIRVDSTVGIGTVFTIDLPKQEEKNGTLQNNGD